MAQRGQFGIRLSLEGGRQVKAELQDVGDAGQRAMQRVAAATDQPSRALLALSDGMRSVGSEMSRFSSRLGPLDGALRGLGVAGNVAAIGFGAIVAGLAAGAREVALADQSFRRLEAVLRATGLASGLTAKEIADFADGMERSTLATAEGVQDAAAVLATFRSVSGETFTRAISLAQDMAAVFGQDLSSSATQLGKALEDPIEGLTALRRVGVSFTDSQKELIATLVETGQTAEAQRVILDALAQQVGGAGAAEANSLIGATHRATAAWGSLLEEIARTTGVAGVAMSAIDAMAARVNQLRSAISEIDNVQRRAENLTRDQAGGGVKGWLSRQFFGSAEDAQQKAFERQTNRVIADLIAQSEADEGRLNAQRERGRELLAGQRAEIEKSLKGLATQAEKEAAINKERDETAKRLRAAAARGDVGVEAELARNEELRRRQLVALAPAGRAAARGGGAARAAGESAAQRDAERASKAIEAALEREADAAEKTRRALATLGDERAKYIQDAVARLPSGASTAQREEMQRRAAASFDLADQLKRAQEYQSALERLKDGVAEAQSELALFGQERAKAIDAELKRFGSNVTDEARALAEAKVAAEERLDLLRRGKALIESSMEPAERYGETLKLIDQLMSGGAIDAGTAARAQVVAERQLHADEMSRLEERRDAIAGLERGWIKYSEAATDQAAIVEGFFNKSMMAMEDSLVGFLNTGKFNFQQFAASIVADIQRIIVRQMIANALAAAIGGAGGGGSIFASLGQALGIASAATGSGAGSSVGVVGTDPTMSFSGSVGSSSMASWGAYHAGGIVGIDPASPRDLPADWLERAPRFHRGAYLRPDEVPAVLQRGEAVLTPAQQRAIGGNVIVNITNNTSARISATERKTPNGREVQVMIEDAVGGALANRTGAAARSARALAPGVIGR